MKGQRGLDSVYGILGTCVHDKLEEIINGEADNDALQAALDQDLVQLEMLGLDFPKDFKGGDTIRENWIADMNHFVRHFSRPPGNFKTEEFLLYKVDDEHYIQGYADLIRLDAEDGSEQSIFDWKTSSLYKGNDIKEHGRQLVIYALAKEQQGIKVNKVAWVFLKYVTVTFMGFKRQNSKNKTLISKHISRRRIVAEMEPYIRSDMAEVGYDSVDIEMYVMQAHESNSLDVLPKQVREKYDIQPCIIEYELTEEVKQECKEYIDRIISEYETRNYESSQWPPRSFYKEGRLGKIEDTFFCNMLCGHRKTCKHLQDFNDEKLKEQQELEAFL